LIKIFLRIIVKTHQCDPEIEERLISQIKKDNGRYIGYIIQNYKSCMDELGRFLIKNKFTFSDSDIFQNIFSSKSAFDGFISNLLIPLIDILEIDLDII